MIDLELWLLSRITSTRLLVKGVHQFVFEGIFNFQNDGPPGARLFFAAQLVDVGQELWVSDGTPAGTMLAVNSAPEEQTDDGMDRIIGETADGLFFYRIHRHLRKRSLGYRWNPAPNPRKLRLAIHLTFNSEVWSARTSFLMKGAVPPVR
ncbi:MAG: hypothetical protein GKR90_10645 [Pseudomonadales bacterium]|nr:hypothetical protein [Pseudomonadales bacterium]